MSKNLRSKREEVLRAAEVAVDELITVLKSKIITHGEEDLTADKLKNAASAKRLSFEDALAMLSQIEKERQDMENDDNPEKSIDLGSKGFAEGRVKKNGR